MANSALLTDCITQYEFVYDPVLQDDFKLRYGMRVDAGEPSPLWHQPDSAPPQLIRLTNKPVTIFLTTIVYGDTWDDVVNTLAPVKRWVDGEDQQAARYHTAGDVSEIFARIQLDGMANYTDWSVIYGYVDDSQAYYVPEADFNTLAYNVVLTLVCEPVGKGAPITLRNDLASSPHFVEDSNSDGLADGWNTFGTITVTLNPVNKLFGKQSQKLVNTSGSAASIYSDTVAMASGVDVVAICIIKVSGTVSVQLETTSPIVDVESKTVTAANAFRTDSVANGDWYWIGLSGTTANASGVRMEIVVSNGATAYVQAAYIQANATTIPNAWCSTSATQNRYDPNSSNEGRINYIDVWGIPGDSNAVVDIKSTVTAASSSPSITYYSRISDNKSVAANRQYWFDTLTGGGVIDGVFSTVSDANRSGGSYLRYTSNGSGSFFNGTLTATIADFKNFATWPSRVFVLARTSNVNSTINIGTISGGASITHSEQGWTSANTWELIDLGALSPADSPLDYWNGTSGIISLQIDAISASKTIDIDSIICLPISDNGWMIGTHSASWSVNDIFYSLGSLRRFYSSVGATPSAYQGELWECHAGNVMNRFIMVTNGLANVYVLTNAVTNEITIYPRTRHLLGTL